MIPLLFLLACMLAVPAHAQTWLGVRGPNRTMHNESRGTLAAAESVRAQAEATYTWTFPADALRTLRSGGPMNLAAVTRILAAEGALVYEGTSPTTARTCIFVVSRQGREREVACGNEFILRPGEHPLRSDRSAASVHPQLSTLSLSDRVSDAAPALRLVDTFASGYVLMSSDSDPATLLKTRSFRDMHLQSDQMAVLLAIMPGTHLKPVRVALQPFAFVFEQVP